MKVGTFALLAVMASLAVLAAEPPPCTAESPWDDGREILARHAHEPESVPIASIDGGNLLGAMNEWFAARAAGDAHRLEKMTIPLGMQYDEATRSWVQMVLKGYTYDVARPLLAQVDPSNPGHVLVLSEVTIRIAGKCSMSAMACDWVKLEGTWMVLPNGPRLVG